MLKVRAAMMINPNNEGVQKIEYVYEEADIAYYQEVLGYICIGYEDQYI